MSKKGNSLLWALGCLTSFLTDLLFAVKELGGTDDDVHRLAKPEGWKLVREVAELVVTYKKRFLDRVYVSFPDLTLENLLFHVTEAGIFFKGDKAFQLFVEKLKVRPNIYNLDKSIDVIVFGSSQPTKVVYFDDYISGEDAVTGIINMGYLPALPHEHLIGVIRYNKELLTDHPNLTAVGATYNNGDGYFSSREVVSIRKQSVGIYTMKFEAFNQKWPKGTGFLVVVPENKRK